MEIDGELQTLSGINRKAFYETMIFKCDGETKDGDPNNELSELFTKYYDDSLVAEKSHRELCLKVAKGWEPDED